MSTRNTKDNCLSDLGMGQVLRNSHDMKDGVLKVKNGISDVPSGYTRVDLTYATDGFLSEARFFKGVLNEITELETVADSSGSLNNKYFLLYSAYTQTTYYVWYNVSGGGTDPAVPNAAGVEVAINTDDPAPIVALATRLTLDCIECFKVTPVGVSTNKIKIQNVEKGPATDTVDFNTGFTVTKIQDGTEELLKHIVIPDSNVKYMFNEYEKKFEVTNSATSVGTNSYNTTDDLANNQDGIVTITATGQPFITVASVSVPAGSTAHVYGWQYACDEEVQARLMTDDGTNEVVYMNDLNTAQRLGNHFTFTQDSRIEIVGSANLEIKVELSRRSGVVNGNGTGSLHVRIL